MHNLGLLITLISVQPSFLFHLMFPFYLCWFNKKNSPVAGPGYINAVIFFLTVRARRFQDIRMHLRRFEKANTLNK
jgi:hypothetical protein